MNFKSLAINLSIASLAVFLALYLGEITFRRLSNSKIFYLPSWPGYSVSLRHNHFQVDDVLGYKPGVEWKGEGGRNGFQNGLEHYPLQNGYTDIALLGDSVIQDMRLFRAFKKILKGSPVRLWNAGIGGYGTTQEAAYLEREIQLPTLDTLILAFCLNDFFPSMIAVRRNHESPVELLIPSINTLAVGSPFLFKHSSIYQTFSILAYRPINKQFVWSPETVRNNTYSVEEGISNIKEWTRKNGVKFLVMVYPHLKEEPQEEWTKEARLQIITILKKHSVPYLDLHTAVHNKNIKLLIAEGDMVHPGFSTHLLFGRKAVDAFPSFFTDLPS